MDFYDALAALIIEDVQLTGNQATDPLINNAISAKNDEFKKKGIKNKKAVVDPQTGRVKVQNVNPATDTAIQQINKLQ